MPKDTNLFQKRMFLFQQACQRERFAEHTRGTLSLHCHLCDYKFLPGDSYYSVGLSPFYCRGCAERTRRSGSLLVFEVPLPGVPEPSPFRATREAK